VKLPFRNPPATVAILLVFIGAFLFGASKCNAEPVLQAELGYTMIRGPAVTFGLNVSWPGAGPRTADFQCGLYLISEYEFGGTTQPNQAIANCMLVQHIRKLDLGIGPAYLQNIDAINGSHFNFALMARYRFTERFALSWLHHSNAGTVSPNKGRDALMLGWGF
jgi:hypothetical protein